MNEELLLKVLWEFWGWVAAGGGTTGLTLLVCWMFMDIVEDLVP